MHLTNASWVCPQVTSPRGVRLWQSNREESDSEQTSWSRKMGPLPGLNPLTATAPALNGAHLRS